MPFGGAGGDVLAAVLEAVPRELPADLDRTDVQVDVLPAQADRLGLADADRERDPRWGPGVTDPSAWWARLGVPSVQALRKLPDRGRPGASQFGSRRGQDSWLAARTCWPACMPGWPTGRGGGLRVAALCGMGGAGKTSVAVNTPTGI